MKLKYYLLEILDDMKQEKSEYLDFYEREHIHAPWERTDSEYKFILLPHILGALTGCAITKLFGLGINGYYILGLIFALAGGVYKSCRYDNISFKHSLIKNIIIIIIPFIPLLTFFLVIKIMFWMV